MRRALTYAATVITIATLAAGCDGGDSEPAAAPAPVPSTAPASTPTTAPPSTEPPSAEPAAPTASPTPSAPAKPQKLKSGAKGAEVLALQKRLNELGYWNGKADGTFGGQTQQAVFALQKAAGLGRDGVVGPKTKKALDEGVRPKAKSTSGRVVEINLKRQLLMLVDDGEVSQVFNTSTGSMEHYEQNGNTFLADTPSGKFKVSRQIDGWRHAPLGLLWRPKYFNGGIAVHGANSVPPYPASHGCARVSISAMNWLWKNDELPLKTRVWVY
ncbi:peptidoglycan-binding protein [Amorphoplanes digitatis]|uniref:Lipoprotein-anchoring transpeptidase ErfK/SrfK n=1 Tax=Actinoplanes digitatis TaxID=1868 RepID=A0A7W7I671_9ACTN|nr:L,D-transpeptidase family protein [Actinoplanes digitatis]MBB4767056.1 lipoprotein-anchoring transpeptidase ErfK/SrfK [Actinoplanes digitatis]GID95579.1 peptidoglycan-binding protein [Actinoplanes digitatis]